MILMASFFLFEIIHIWAACGVDEHDCGVRFNELFADWLDQWVAKNREAEETTNGTETDTSLVYRFAHKTLASSRLTSLLQSVLHQLCYLVQAHESWAFGAATLDQLVARMQRLVRLHFARRAIRKRLREQHNKESKQDEDEEDEDSDSDGDLEPREQLLVVIDRIDRVLYTPQDVAALCRLLDKLYEALDEDKDTSPLRLKIVLTYYAPAAAAHDDSSSLVAHVEKRFGAPSVARIASSSSAVASLSTNNNNSGNSGVLDAVCDKWLAASSVTQHFVKCLFVLLEQTRYGMKECELVQLVIAYTRAHEPHILAKLQQPQPAATGSVTYYFNVMH